MWDRGPLMSQDFALKYTKRKCLSVMPKRLEFKNYGPGKR